VTLMACQEAGERRLRPNVKAVTFAAADTMGASVVFRSDELDGRLEKRQQLREEEQNEG
jgi:hypothetical protein